MSHFTHTAGREELFTRVIACQETCQVRIIIGHVSILYAQNNYHRDKRGNSMMGVSEYTCWYKCNSISSIMQTVVIYNSCYHYLQCADVELQKLKGQGLFDEDRFGETQKQFNNKNITITVSGCRNSGKSTLINALLGFK